MQEVSAVMLCSLLSFEIQMNKKSFRGFRETGHWPGEFYIYFFLLISCYIIYFILYSINPFNFVPCKAHGKCAL